MSFLDFLLGRPLASREDQAQKIGPGRGIGVFGLDALGSAAYGPEAALTMLIPVGMVGLQYITSINLVIVVLICIVFVSYSQTIKAYPNGGGTYTVASENLGDICGLIAGTALMIDYALVVAVGISAGVGALISVFPSLRAYTLLICLFILLLLTLINLRGTNDTGGFFLFPAYLFVVCMLAVLFIGLWKVLSSGGHPQAIVPPPSLKGAGEVVTFWLLLKTYSSGCTAITGIEAVSNGVPVFRDPRTRNARITLSVVIGILVIMLILVAYLCHVYRIGAINPDSEEYKSILYLVIVAVVGNGWFSYIAIASVLLVLVFQANTAFTGFPRLCSIISRNGYLPQGFANRGRRLVYSHGIYILSFFSALLLLIFGGITDRLIPLFAIGAFVAYTFSQAGMVMHWRRTKEKHRQLNIFINGLGMVATGITALVVLVSKFSEGAWALLLVAPAILFFMIGVGRHYRKIERQLVCNSPVSKTDIHSPIIVLPIDDWNNVSHKAIHTALSLSKDIIVLHIKAENEDTTLIKQWKKLVEEPLIKMNQPVPKLNVLKSPYRLVVRPIVDFVFDLESKHPERRIAVLIPKLVERKWYQRFLHNQRYFLLSGLLMYKGNKRIMIIHVPWYLKDK